MLVNNKPKNELKVKVKPIFLKLTTKRHKLFKINGELNTSRSIFKKEPQCVGVTKNKLPSKYNITLTSAV